MRHIHAVSAKQEQPYCQEYISMMGAAILPRVHKYDGKEEMEM